MGPTKAGCFVDDYVFEYGSKHNRWVGEGKRAMSSQHESGLGYTSTRRREESDSFGWEEVAIQLT